jgi:hypothetical protein
MHINLPLESIYLKKTHQNSLDNFKDLLYYDDDYEEENMLCRRQLVG